MPTLKEIRTRIASVSSIRQTTSAMKMVSASKLHRAQDRIVRLRPYAERMQRIMEHVLRTVEGESEYAEQRELQHLLIVVIASNKGLCGALNTNVVKEAIQLAETEYGPLMRQGAVSFMAFGEKARALLKKKQVPLADAPFFQDQFDSQFTKPIADRLAADFLAGRFDRIIFVYHSFKNAASQQLTCQTFLPFTPAPAAEPVRETDYILEPDKQTLRSVLLPDTLRLTCFRYFCEASASEHGIRMVVMHQATDNADALTDTLTLQYNKARQAAITSQLVEIVSSTEAQL